MKQNRLKRDWQGGFPDFRRVGVYKNVAPESVQDEAFTEPIRREMKKRGVPETIIRTLFNTSDAAPTDTALKEL